MRSPISELENAYGFAFKEFEKRYKRGTLTDVRGEVLNYLAIECDFDISLRDAYYIAEDVNDELNHVAITEIERRFNND